MAGVREQDQYMPIANVIRIMRRILPSHAKISEDAKETIQECVSEFISFITAEANERCQLEQRKTVTAEDLLWAMEKLGFDNYVHPLALFLQRYRECEGEPASVRRTSSTVMPPPPQAQYPNPSPSALPSALPSSNGNSYYVYGFGGSVFDFDQGLYRDNNNDAAGPSSSSSSVSGSGSGAFGPSFDYSFPHVKRDPI